MTTNYVREVSIGLFSLRYLHFEKKLCSRISRLLVITMQDRF